MGLEKRKRPEDPAPDWNEQSFGGRAYACAAQLQLFNFITDEEARAIHERIEAWVNKIPQRFVTPDGAGNL